MRDMATVNAGFSLVLDIMRLFRQGDGKQDAWTVEEIQAQISENLPWRRWYWEPHYLRRSLSGNIQDAPTVIRAILASLGELGVVSVHGERETSSGFERWRIAPSWRPPALPPNGDGGGDVPGAVNEGDGEGGEGGGLRETLSHPVLFSLDQDDFDQLVDGLFVGGRE
jgi:hypothetical protein